MCCFYSIFHSGRRDRDVAHWHRLWTWPTSTTRWLEQREWKELHFFIIRKKSNEHFHIIFFHTFILLPAKRERSAWRKMKNSQYIYFYFYDGREREKKEAKNFSFSFLTTCFARCIHDEWSLRWCSDDDSDDGNGYSEQKQKIYKKNSQDEIEFSHCLRTLDGCCCVMHRLRIRDRVLRQSDKGYEKDSPLLHRLQPPRRR